MFNLCLVLVAIFSYILLTVKVNNCRVCTAEECVPFEEHVFITQYTTFMSMCVLFFSALPLFHSYLSLFLSYLSLSLSLPFLPLSSSDLSLSLLSSPTSHYMFLILHLKRWPSSSFCSTLWHWIWTDCCHCDSAL